MNPDTQTLQVLLRSLRLPGFLDVLEPYAAEAEKHGWTHTEYLRALAEHELTERKRRRVERHQRSSQLPSDKTLTAFDQKRLSQKVRGQLNGLLTGDFVGRAENVLAFGLPGRGKTHLLCAVGHELIQRGHRVLFTPAFQLVQQLLAAKRDLELEKLLRRLDHFDVVLIDDIGYVQHDRDEMEVLFTFLAERYERRSVMISSNLVFSQWDKIFRDPMTTAAAIDRLVHHSMIIEITGESYREETANKKQRATRKKKSEGEQL